MQKTAMNNIELAISILETATNDNFQERLNAVNALLGFKGEKTCNLFEKLIRNGENEFGDVLQKAGYGLCISSSAKTDRQCKDFINDQTIRFSAKLGILEALHDRFLAGDNSAAKIFSQAAASKDSEVRKATLRMCLKLPSAVSEKILIAALSDDKEIAIESRQIISERLLFRSSKIQEALISIGLGKLKCNHEVRLHVISDLGSILKLPEVRAALNEMLFEKNQSVREAAEKALTKL